MKNRRYIRTSALWVSHKLLHWRVRVAFIAYALDHQSIVATGEDGSGIGVLPPVPDHPPSAPAGGEHLSLQVTYCCTMLTQPIRMLRW
jgi:hypothetical protein